MRLRTEGRPLRWLFRIYGVMLLTYPREFRRGYAREMQLVFQDRARDVARTRGSWALLPFVLAVVWDWLRSNIDERGNMRDQQVNRISGVALSVLSLCALAPLLVGALRILLVGPAAGPGRDEGVGAHLFQLSIVALVPAGLVFLATADWKRPLRSARPLVIPVATTALAFGLLFYFEHYYLPAHGAPLPRPGVPLRLLRQLRGSAGA